MLNGHDSLVFNYRDISSRNVIGLSKCYLGHSLRGNTVCVVNVCNVHRHVFLWFGYPSIVNRILLVNLKLMTLLLLAACLFVKLAVTLFPLFSFSFFFIFLGVAVEDYNLLRL